MSRGKRYNNEPKLNIKKVIAVIFAIILIVMFIIGLKSLLNSDSSSNNLVSTTYFLLNEDEKWGVIDNTSKIIIEPTYDEMIIIPNSKKDIFICTYDMDYENNTYKTKVIDSKNKEILIGYDEIKPVENYDKFNNLWYEENVLIIKKDNKYGLINFNGENILDANYDDIYALKGSKNSIITVKDKKLGLVNNLGKELIENEYDNIEKLGENNDLYIVKSNDKYGIYGKLECKYEDIKNFDSENVYCVKLNGQYQVIDKSENTLLNEKFTDIEEIKDNVIIYKVNNEYNAYNLKENKKLDRFYKELKYTSNNIFIFKLNDNYGIIDIDNNIKVEEQYISINYYSDADVYELESQDEEENTILDKNLNKITNGIVNETNKDKNYIKIWTEQGYKYYNLKGEEKASKEILTQNNLFLDKKNGKYGFIDKKGNIIVDYIYDDAKEQNEFGYIAVKKDGLWGALNKKGNIICQVKYNLDNNLLIDFIGEYHLGIDINLMYYTSK